MLIRPIQTGWPIRTRKYNETCPISFYLFSLINNNSVNYCLTNTWCRNIWVFWIIWTYLVWCLLITHYHFFCISVHRWCGILQLRLRRLCLIKFWNVYCSDKWAAKPIPSLSRFYSFLSDNTNRIQMTMIPEESRILHMYWNGIAVLSLPIILNTPETRVSRQA